MSAFELAYVTLGELRQDFYITHDGRAHLGILGGNAVYSAIGARLWAKSVGLLSRVGSDFPTRMLDELNSAGINIDSVKQLPEPINTYNFYAYLSLEERVYTNPASHFLRINQPLPKVLLDYHCSMERQDDQEKFIPLALRPDDLPQEMVKIRGAHLAPADFLTHTTVPFRLKELGVHLVTLDPSECYMDPGFEKELPIIVRGLDAFLPSEEEARSYFQLMDLDIWEMAEAFGAMGCHYVVIKQGARGQCVWDEVAKHRWHIPAYPARVKDVTGAGDAYCGGFMVGLEQTGDVVEAALRGSISASIIIEGSGALNALDVLPGLVQARLEALRSSVKLV